MISYSGADCSGEAYFMIPGTAARNVPFTMPGDSTIHRLPKTNPVAVGIQSSTNGTTCSNFAVTLSGFRVADTVPATPLVPPTLSWKGPIKATWVE